jgi:50S ribosomal protein L16 3-hydroxylase
LGEAFLQFMADSIELPGRYADPELTVTMHPGEIGASMLAKIEQALNRVKFTQEDITIFLGEYLTEPKSSVFFDSPARLPGFSRFVKFATKRGLALSRKTKMLHRSKYVFINGESFIARRADRSVLSAMADHRTLPGPCIATASEDAMAAFYVWYQAGWLDYPG